MTPSFSFRPLAAASALLLLATAQPAGAQSGTLDPSFGTGGLVVYDAYEFGGASAVALTASGDLAVAGTNGCTCGGEEVYTFTVVQFNPDGTEDFYKPVTFGEPEDEDSAFASDVAVQADGKIVAAGSWTHGFSDFALARLTPDGDYDNSFGGDGRVTTDFDGSYDAVNAVVVQADGKVVAAG